MGKKERIKQELERLTDIFGSQEIIQPIVENAAFLRVTLEDLQDIVAESGPIEEYQNGANQRGVKQSAAVQSYNAMLKTYMAALKLLSDYAPKKALKTFTPDNRKIDTEQASQEEYDYWAKRAGELRREGQA